MSRATDRVYARIDRFWKNNQTTIAIVSLVALFLVIFFWNSVTVSIYAGEQGVLWKRFSGTVISTSYDEGFHLIWPWNEMTVYNLRVQEHRDTITALTNDGMEMTIQFSILYRPFRSELGFIHRSVGPEYPENLVYPISVASIRQIIGTLRTEEIIAMPEDSLLTMIQNTIHSDRFRVQTENVLRGTLSIDDSKSILPRLQHGDNGQVVVEDLINLFQVDVKLHALSLPPKVQAAINSKLVHEQLEQSYAFRLSLEEKEKIRKKLEAEGIRDFEEISGISILQWRGIEATESLAVSNNSKIVIIGTDQNELPILLNGDAK